MTPDENKTQPADDKTRSAGGSFAREVIETPVHDEVADSFLSYSLSVITARAIPDVRDGLKPVQRRILYSLDQQSIRPSSPYKKCARVVGDCMGKYHPHGDSAIYEALVRMAQPFSLRVPLVDGHGNFGSPDDGPAASRYCVTGDTRVLLADGTEVRFDELGELLGVTVEPNSTVEISLKVAGLFGVAHASRLHHSGTHPVFRIVTADGTSLRATGNHPVLTGTARGVMWALVENLTPGNEIVQVAVDGDWTTSKVVSVTADGAAPVYSLRVDTDDHAFVTNGLVSHNTECRMDNAAMEMIGELAEDAVDFRPNYDGTEREPEVLPARLPNLLVNGGTGIAVGMATNIAPHNIAEVTAAAIAVLDDPKIGLDALMAHLPGPDFPTGGILIDAGGVREAYATGRGSFRIRARAEVGQVSAKRRGITITELPYSVGPERFIAKCKQLISNGQLSSIADIKDLSDRKRGLCLVIECKAGVNPQAVLAELYQKTPLEENFSVNAVALVAGRPETLGVHRMLSLYLEHRLGVIVRRTQFRLTKAQDRAHIVEGLVTALASIDEVVAILKGSRDAEIARTKLQKTFALSEIQAGHILDMPLRRLTGLEVTKLKDELKALRATIKDLQDLLAKPARQRSVVRDELQEAAERYATPRRTKLIGAADAELPVQALEIPDEPCSIVVTAAGLLARPGKRRAKPAKTDAHRAGVDTTTRGVARLVTETGRLVSVDAVDIPEASAKLPGVSPLDVADIERNETIVAVVGELGEGATLLLATAGGTVKRLTADQLGARSAQVISLKDGDTVAGACVVADTDEYVLVTSDGQLLRSSASAVRPQGRSGGGVAGIKLADGAKVIAVGRAEGSIHTLTDAGRYKHTPVAEYPAKGRGTGGVRCMRLRSGDTVLTDALIGDGTVCALGARGSVEALERPAAKRDATGEDVSDASRLAWW